MPERRLLPGLQAKKNLHFLWEGATKYLGLH